MNKKTTNEKTTFKNAPVVEIVAELRWDPISSTKKGNKDKTQKLSNSAPATTITDKAEEFFSYFTEEIAEEGFQQSERLIPRGISISSMPFQFQPAVLRFKRSQTEPFSFQLGDGIFSAHAMQPYKSWEHFKPIIQSGISALINSRKKNKNANIKSFTAASLRYLDIFKSDILGTQDADEFISNILKIQMDYPENLRANLGSQLYNNSSPLIQNIQVVLPLKNDINMVLDLRKGISGSNQDEKVVVMNTLASIKKGIGSKTEIVNFFDEAHKIIYDTFIEITKPIHHVMDVDK
ncbi:MAG: TIGR04255 family protein [bacterium]